MYLSLYFSFLLGFVVLGDDRLAVAVDELQDLKGVWQELGKIWELIDELRDKPWLSVQPRKVSPSLPLSLFLCFVCDLFSYRSDSLLMGCSHK